MKSFSITSLVAAAVLAVSSAFAQFAPISLPATSFAGVATTGNTTNLGLGWSSQSIITNITTAWSPTSSPPVMVTSTNYSTNSFSQFADFDALGKDYVSLQLSFTNNTGGSVSNIIYAVAKSTSKKYFDTQNWQWRTNAGNGTTLVSDDWQIDMRGFPYGRVVWMTYSNLNTAQSLQVLEFNAGNNGQTRRTTTTGL